MHEFQVECPVGWVFHPIELVCTKDLTACAEPPFVCDAVGHFLDKFDQSRYHICSEDENDSITHTSAQCAYGKIFDEHSKKCIFPVADMSAMLNSADENTSSDSDESNKKDNQSKDRDSNEEKKDTKSKDEEKKNEKKKNKKNKDQQKNDSEDDSNNEESQESEIDSHDKDFECSSLGRFADAGNERKYYICDWKDEANNKFKKHHLKCEKKYKFNSLSAVCEPED